MDPFKRFQTRLVGETYVENYHVRIILDDRLEAVFTGGGRNDLEPVVGE